MSPPVIQRLPALGHELVALIDGRDAGDGSDLMVEDLVSHMRRNTQTRHSGYTGAAQIVQPPIAHATDRIEPYLVVAKALKRPGTLRKYELTRTRPPLQNAHRLGRDVDDMGSPVLGARARQAPN